MQSNLGHINEERWDLTKQPRANIIREAYFISWFSQYVDQGEGVLAFVSYSNIMSNDCPTGVTEHIILKGKGSSDYKIRRRIFQYTFF